MKEPKIIFTNEAFFVLDKPVGLTVNKSETTTHQLTLEDWLEKKFQFKNLDPQKTSEDFYKRKGIVHRLDKDTSGVILVARTPQAFINLQSQFKNRQVKKTYLALVWGKLLNKGEIKAPICRNPFNRFKFGVFLNGREAQTQYQVIKNTSIDDQDVSLLEVFPLTGRTHQIRVHLHYLGHPIVGDPLYSGRKLYKKSKNLFGRLMLHAYKISFIEPLTHQPKEFTAHLPDEFTKIM